MNAVITGATRGIGKAIAEKFCGEGFNVAICSRSKKDLDECYNELHRKYPDVEILTQVCDVSDKKQLKSFAATIKSRWTTLDVLVNNAGIFLPGQVHQEKDGTLEKQMKANLYSAYYLTQYLIKYFIRQRHGHIFNIGSIAGMHAYPHGGSYSISKFALSGFSKNLRLEMMAYGVKVTLVNLGAVLTAMWEGTHQPESRFIKPDDVALVIWDAWSLSASAALEDLVLRPLEGDL